MLKDSIVVYWSPATTVKRSGADWSYLYPKPISLFSDLKKKSSKQDPSFFACPAVSPKFKKTLVCYNPIDASYVFDFRNGKTEIKNTSENWISVEQMRDQGLSIGPTLELAITYAFFAEESLDTYFTPPFFHEPKYTKYASVIPGEYDIGKWFRTYNAEMQFWNNYGELYIQKDEPLFYAEFKTNKKIILKQFVMTDQIFDYIEAGVNNKLLFGKFKSLSERYKQFKHVGMREKILTAIKKNLVEEEPTILN